MTRFIVSCGLVTMLLLSGGSALARELQPQLLPPLQVPGAVTVPERAAPLRWQLSQRFRHDFNSGRGSLSLSPSVTVLLHDPQAGTAAGLAAAAAELDALAARLDQLSERLPVWRDYLQLQLLLQNAELTALALELWPDLIAADAEGSVQPDQLRLETLAADIDGNIELMIRRLHSAGVGFSSLPTVLYRPEARIGPEPVAACLSGSTTIRQLELVAELELLGAENEQLGREYQLELDLGASMNVSAEPAGTAFSVNASLRVHRADWTGPQLQLDVGSSAVTQSFTLRGPESAAAAEPQWSAHELQAATEAEAVRLYGLLLAAEQTARQERLAHHTLAGQMERFGTAVEAGTATQAQLESLLQAGLELQQARFGHDQLQVELAAECSVAVDWTELQDWP